MARILVVDDNASVCHAVAKLLRVEGHDAWCVTSGSEALGHLKENPPDLLLLDLMMPGVDGFAVLEALRQEPAPAPAVVAYSAADDPQNRLRAMELGAR